MGVGCWNGVAEKTQNTASGSGDGEGKGKVRKERRMVVGRMVIVGQCAKTFAFHHGTKV